ncbi:MAG: prolipoprotein diacylglyceryl transferase [Clostridia bacterium]|nr:prolipoprotein diacylglyceryl transferase [Clostridia bacterium]
MHPQPLFTIFGQGVYLYGICFALGILCCFVFLYITMWKKKFSETSCDAVIFIGIFGTGFGILTAMLFQATYNYISNPAAGFDFGGSMTFIGGLIGGVVSFVGVWNLYMYVIRPRTKLKFLLGNMNAGLTDALPFIPIGITIAHAFGRFGCFWAGCCYGKETDAWYGMYCAKHYNSYTGVVSNGNLVIPTQLFEMFFLIILCVVMAVLYFKFKFNYNFAVYAIAYGIWRFLLEFIRGDSRGEFIGNALSPSQIWSIVMVLIGIGYIFVQKYFFSKLMKHPELSEPAQEEEKPVEQPAQT